MALLGKIFGYFPEKVQLHSGEWSPFLIDCDDLGFQDWDALAKLVVESGLSFRAVVSVPTGGDRFANALSRYIDEESDTTLIVDDVYTTGSSMEAAKQDVEGIVQGVVVFARRQPPEWIAAIFDGSAWRWQ